MKAPYHPGELLTVLSRAEISGDPPSVGLPLLLTLIGISGDKDVLARHLLTRFGTFRGIVDAEPIELVNRGGLTANEAARLAAIRIAARMYLRERAEGTNVFVQCGRLAEVWRMKIGSLTNEVFEVAHLDSKYRLIHGGIETVQEGTIDRVSVYPRKIMTSALRRNTTAVILAHNHPNGTLIPTPEDKLITRALVLAGETVSVKVLDHLIVSADDTFSFKAAGLL